MDLNTPRRRRWTDARRINPLEERDRAYWAKFFGVDEDDVLNAVDKVGTSAEAVRQFLNSWRTRHWIVDGGRNERRGSSPRRRHFPSPGQA